MNIAEKTTRELLENLMELLSFEGISKSQVMEWVAETDPSSIEQVTRLEKSGLHNITYEDIGKVCQRWLSAIDYTDEIGDPSTLPIEGEKGSLESLVKEIDKSLDHKAMLAVLLSINAVRVLKANKVELIKTIPILGEISEVGAKFHIESLAELSRTLIENIKAGAEKDNATYHRGTYTLNMAADAWNAFQSEFEKSADAFIFAAGELMDTYEEEGKENPKPTIKKAGAHVFLYRK